MDVQSDSAELHKSDINNNKSNNRNHSNASPDSPATIRSLFKDLSTSTSAASESGTQIASSQILDFVSGL